MVLAAGAVLLGAPALAMLAHEPQAVMVSVSLVRGLGFGLCGVVTGTLTATLLPPGRRGEGLGPARRCFGGPDRRRAAGRDLARRAPSGPRRRVDVSFVRPLPLAVVLWLPGGREAHRSVGARRMPGGHGSARIAGAALRLPLIFAAATIAAGVLDSFLPLAKGVPSNLCSASLLVQAIIATLSRWQPGKQGDRHGHARLLVPALGVAALGMAAMFGLSSPAGIFEGMACSQRPGAGWRSRVRAAARERPARPARCGTSPTTPVRNWARPSRPDLRPLLDASRGSRL